MSRSSSHLRRVELPDRSLSYTLRRSARRRTIGLKICDAGLTVILPPRVSASEADAVVIDKARWVIDHLDRRDACKKPQLQGVDGEAVGWLGAPLKLSVVAHDKARSRVEQSSKALTVCVDAQLDAAARARAVMAAVKRWRKREALALMTPKLEHYADMLGARRPKVSVREQKSRWGSCSVDGSIRMNARLIAYPETLIDYVCAHEACHLLVMDHSPRFHALLNGLMPDQKHRRTQLRHTAPAGMVY